MISQRTLLAEANKWEPEASQSPQSYRMAHCAFCGRRLWLRMYHCWINIGGFKKELHFHKRCYRELEAYDQAIERHRSSSRV